MVAAINLLWNIPRLLVLLCWREELVVTTRQQHTLNSKKSAMLQLLHGSNPMPQMHRNLSSHKQVSAGVAVPSICWNCSNSRRGVGSHASLCPAESQLRNVFRKSARKGVFEGFRPVSLVTVMRRRYFWMSGMTKHGPPTCASSFLLRPTLTVYFNSLSNWFCSMIHILVVVRMNR